MSKKNEIIFTSIILTIICVLGATVFSLDIALTPGSVDFGSVLREGFSEGSFTFSTYSETPITVRLYNTERNNTMDQWVFMHFLNGTTIKINDVLTLDKDHPLRIFVTFEPGSDAPNGNYQTTVGATIEGNLDGSNVEEGQTVARIKTGVSVKLFGKIEDVETLSCQASNIAISNPELGEQIIVTSKIKNTGNIYLNPKIEVEIWDSQKSRMIKKYDGNLGIIKPTISSETQFDIDSTAFAPGSYIASLYIRQCNVENRLINFEVLNIGSKSMDGRIKYVNIPSIIYGYKPIQVTVLFENLGADATVARFSGGIYKDNNLIATLDSVSSIAVKAKEAVEIDAGYFTPSQTRNNEDRYVLKGKVYYGNKQTEEYSKVFFVKKELVKSGNNLNSVLIIAMILIIVILIYVLIRRQKK